MNLSDIESIVSRYRKHVRVGMKLYYTDAAGGECYEVTEVTDDILTVKDSAGNGADLLFDSLQIGWEFSEADREHIRLITEPLAPRLFQVGDRVKTKPARSWGTTEILRVTQITTHDEPANANPHHRLMAVSPCGNSYEAAEDAFTLVDSSNAQTRTDFWTNYYIQERIDAVSAERPEWFTGHVNDY